MTRQFYSTRVGTNRNAEGFSLDRIKDLFLDLFMEMREDGYFSEFLGWYCVDEGDIAGKIRNPSLDILLKVRSEGLWPVDEKIGFYNEDDLFDVMEYLHTCVSKPTDGQMHHFSNCGMHWDKFDKSDGEIYYVNRTNELLSLYSERYEMSSDGQILRAVDEGFETLFVADAPTNDLSIREKLRNATIRYRRHVSSLEDRRVAVRELADILEYIRPKLALAIDKKDESDLFNIANNFAIRHHNPKQKTGYDSALWLSWMFYFYLATIHLALRKINQSR